jgi:hypothetical protein
VCKALIRLPAQSFLWQRGGWHRKRKPAALWRKHLRGEPFSACAALGAAAIIESSQRKLPKDQSLRYRVLHSRRVCVEGHCPEQSLRQSFALLSAGLVQERARFELKSWHTQIERSSSFTLLHAGTVYEFRGAHSG